MSKNKDSAAPIDGPFGDDQLQSEMANFEAAQKIKQAEDQVKETAHDIERDLK